MADKEEEGRYLRTMVAEILLAVVVFIILAHAGVPTRVSVLESRVEAFEKFSVKVDLKLDDIANRLPQKK